jgi:hypothetical protein
MDLTENRSEECDLCVFLYQWKGSKIPVYFNECSERSFCRQTTQEAIYRKKH